MHGNIKANVRAGGITANLYKFASITNCYNIGTIQDTGNQANVKCIGGITATSWLTLSDRYKIMNCYNVGKILTNSDVNIDKVYMGNVSGLHEQGIIRNCYYINNRVNAIGENEDNQNVETILEINNEDFKKAEMINRLNNSSNEFVFDVYNINNGYPILKYQFTVIKGDANGDGKVDFKDILTINKHRLNKVPLTGEHLEASDVNNDGKVDFKDILKINKYRLGKISTL